MRMSGAPVVALIVTAVGWAPVMDAQADKEM
jgi:hypothetical protein